MTSKRIIRIKFHCKFSWRENVIVINPKLVKKISPQPQMPTLGWRQRKSQGISKVMSGTRECL